MTPIKRLKMLGIFIIMFTFTTVTSSLEIRQDFPSNHKESLSVSNASSLKMEARSDYDGLDLNTIESTSKPSESISTNDDKSEKPAIVGSTSKVSIVFSERKPSETEKVVKPNSAVEDRSWRSVKVSSRDSYLDALDHSHSSKDPREGVVRVDTRPKAAKLIRRDYSEGPVYRPSSDHYGAPKDSSSSYSSSNDAKRGTSKILARISYGGPTQETFLPTPSDSYSLPVQSSTNFNNNNNNIHDEYGAPQASYGAPGLQTNYGVPSNSYGPAPLPQNSYGPPSNGYPPSGIPQQAYGPPASSYGAPYAIQDYAQHLPSLPSIDFFWPFALKLNVFTVAKILLKLVIFKMIVKFIAVICLLLFIPKLEFVKKGDKDHANDDDEGRKLLASDSTLERLNILTALVTSSIEKYEKENTTPLTSGEECTSFGCRMRKLITFEESWKDYIRLFKSYVAEETNADEDERTQTNHIDS